jgi:adenylate cyclase
MSLIPGMGPTWLKARRASAARPQRTLKSETKNYHRRDDRGASAAEAVFGNSKVVPVDDISSGSGSGSGRLQLGRFVLDLDARELLSADGELAGLRKQALEVLLVLAARPGQVVGKDELMQRVWPRVIVGEGSLTQAIADIRRVLGDGDHRIVRNVARRGYLLAAHTVADPLASLATAAVLPALPALPASPASPATAAAPAATALRLRLAAGFAVLVILAFLVFGGYLRHGRTYSRALQAAPGAVSLVVLPLEVDRDAAGNEGGDAWFAEALLDDLILEVGRLGTSDVIARTTAQAFKGTAADPRAVARELGVRYVVQGRLHAAGGRIDLVLTLIDGESGTQRWSERFVVERSRLDRALDDFVRQLARHLEVEVVRSAGARIGEMSEDAVTADDLRLRGRSIWYRGFNRHNLVEALALFEKAVALDPDSRAWAGIAIMSNLGAANGWLPDRRAALDRVEEASRHLDRIDPESFSAMQVKTMVAYRIEGGGPETLRLSKAWAERYPQPIALGGYGYNLILNGRPEEAIAPLERALRLSPRDVFRAEWQYRLALAHFLSGRFAQAHQWGHEAQVSNPALPWPPVHAAAAARLGDELEAKRILAGFLRRHPGYDADRIVRTFDGPNQQFLEGRARLTASLKEIGLP